MFFFSFFSFLFQSTLLTANHDFDATTSIDLVVWIGGKSFETYRNGSSGRFILVFVIGGFNDASVERKNVER